MLFSLIHKPFGRYSSIRCSNAIAVIFASNLLLALILEICLHEVSASAKVPQQQIEDNEFAEFEEMDEFDEDASATNKVSTPGPATPQTDDTQAKTSTKETAEDTEATVEEEDDEEEFENVVDSDSDTDNKDRDRSNNNNKKQDLKITKVPLHLRSNWESYYLEFLMIAGLFLYFINFIAGRNKNYKLASTWFEVHKELLYSNFALVGDDGKKDIENAGIVKETESVFTLWCSGRVCVEGMLVELRFLKRQDLVNTISRMIKPASDQIVGLVLILLEASYSYEDIVSNGCLVFKFS